LNGREYEAWFNTSGIWLQAEYAVTYTSVPAAIKDFIANSIDYPPTLWTPDAATEVLERKNYPDWYAVELENGANEVTIGLMPKLICTGQSLKIIVETIFLRRFLLLLLKIIGRLY